MAKNKIHSLVTGHLEKINADVFTKYQREITDMIKGHQGIYALYRGQKLYYVGLASNLRNRIKHHLKDRHQGKWTHFSLYIIRHSDHIKELESLLLRIAFPQGNHQKGKLTGSDNLLPELKRLVKLSQERDLNDLWDDGKPAKKKIANPRPIKAIKNKSNTRSESKRPLKGFFPGGKMIYATYQGQGYKAWLKANGGIVYKNTLYDTPSAAGSAIRGGKATNGWTFWKYKDEEGKLVMLKTMKKG